MSSSDRFFMSSPRFYVEKDKDEVEDYRSYRRDRDYTSGRHSIADLSLSEYRDFDYDRSHRQTALIRSSRFDRRSRSSARSISRSRSRSSSSSRSRSTHHSRRSKSHHRSSHKSSRKHRHRSRSSSSSSSDASNASSITAVSALGPPPQFVTPVNGFKRTVKGDLTINVGDIIEVKRYVDRNWYKGTNLTTKKKGIFPIAYAKEIEISSTKAVEPLSAGRTSVSSSSTLVVRQRAASQPRIVRDEMIVNMPKETEKKGSFFYPSDTVIVRDRTPSRKSVSGRIVEIDREVLLVKPKDTVNHESAHIVQPTIERDVYRIDAPRKSYVEEDITVIKPRRAIEAAPSRQEDIVIPIRREEISLRDIPKYSRAPEVDIKTIRARSNSIGYAPDVYEIREIEPRRSRVREVDELTVTTARSPRSKSVAGIVVERSPSPVRTRRKTKEFKALPPAKTITYNEYGAPVMVDTQTFAPAPMMQPPPRPTWYNQTTRTLDPEPVPVLPQVGSQRNHRVYQY